jgi:putative ABC transport system permease protein
MRMRNGLYHLLQAAVVDFRRNKVRTLLTSLGIMIGVLSVVMLIALGLGLKNYITEQFENLGTNLVMVMPGSGLGGDQGAAGFGAGIFGGTDFDERDVARLKRVANVDYVVPVFFKSVMVESGGEEEAGYVMGMNEEIFEVMNIEVLAGEFFNKADVASRSKKVVLGYELAKSIFEQPEDAVGRTIRVSDQRFKVVGVAKKKGDREMDNAVVIPYKTTYGGLNPDKTFWAIYLGVKSEDKVDEVKREAEEVLARRYDEDDFSVSDQSELLSTVNQIFGIINTVLVAIGSISLLVGGIGIMNIMYASVLERTKEVGIRRAVGATRRDVLLQFLTESVVLSVLGGAMGLVLAGLIVVIVRYWFPVALNLVAVAVAFGVSTGIGVFFGVFPARRAAKLPPIEAIRYE